jgi:hypothetical protein
MLRAFLWKEKGVMAHPYLRNGKFLTIIVDILMILGVIEEE